MKVEECLFDLILYSCDGGGGAGRRRRLIDLPTITKDRGGRNRSLFAKPYEALLDQSLIETRNLL